MFRGCLWNSSNLDWHISLLLTWTPSTNGLNATETIIIVIIKRLIWVSCSGLCLSLLAHTVTIIALQLLNLTVTLNHLIQWTLLDHQTHDLIQRVCSGHRGEFGIGTIEIR